METRVVSQTEVFVSHSYRQVNTALESGCDGYHDVEVPKRGNKTACGRREEKKSDPWQRAKVVTVTAGHKTSRVEVSTSP